MGRITWIAGLLVLVSGFLPWWTVQVWTSSSARPEWYVEVTNSSAWRVSTIWTVALLLAATSAVCGALWRRSVALAGVGSSLGLVAWQWIRIERVPLDGGPSAWFASASTSATSESFAEAWRRRDQLYSHDSPGSLYVDISWGFWAGLAAIVLLGIAVYVRPSEP